MRSYQGQALRMPCLPPRLGGRHGVGAAGLRQWQRHRRAGAPRRGLSGHSRRRREGGQVGGMLGPKRSARLEERRVRGDLRGWCRGRPGCGMRCWREGAGSGDGKQ